MTLITGEESQVQDNEKLNNSNTEEVIQKEETSTEEGENKEITSNKDIVLKIDNFQGPLELLLHLIEKKKMKISEIRITQIIDEYLTILEESKKDHLDIKVEFVLIAAELLEIKAYSILNLEKERQSEKELKRRLEEYKLFKELTKEIAQIENEFNISYTRGEGREIRKIEAKEYNLEDLTLEDVFNSYKKYLVEQNREVIEINYERAYILEEEIEKLKVMVYEGIKKIDEVFARNEGRTHLVYIFLAVLDAYKEGSIDIIRIENEIYLKKQDTNYLEEITEELEDEVMED